MSSKNNMETEILMENEIIEHLEDSKFLRSLTTASGDCTKEIRRRVDMAN